VKFDVVGEEREECVLVKGAQGSLQVDVVQLDLPSCLRLDALQLLKVHLSIFLENSKTYMALLNLIPIEVSLENLLFLGSVVHVTASGGRHLGKEESIFVRRRIVYGQRDFDARIHIPVRIDELFRGFEEEDLFGRLGITV
jgi:hypothetical protein